jgi:hypothetical protein
VCQPRQEIKDPGRGIGPEGSRKEINPSRVSVIVISIRAYFMAYGVINSISMSAFVEGALVA